MKLYSNQLAANLKQLAPVYLVFGDEPLQKLEAIDAIRHACKQQGFDERLSFTQDPQFSWSELAQAGQAMSLFSPRQLIELELANNKPGQDGAKALTQLLSHPNPDLVLLIHGPKAGQDVQRAKWFKSLEQQGVFVMITLPEGRRLNQWMSERARQHGLNFDSDALARFTAMFEGNLLAANQEMEKLALQLGNQRIDNNALRQRVSHQSRFNLFQMVDLLLAGELPKALRILDQLQNEGSEANLLSWALTKEINLLQQLKQAQLQRKNLAAIYKEKRIWESRQQRYRQCLQRLDMPQLNTMAILVAQIDAALKQYHDSPWPLFTQLCLLFEPQAHRRYFPLEH